MILIVALLALVLLLAPILSGVPDEPLYSSWLCALVMAAVLLAISRTGRAHFFLFRREKSLAQRAETAFAVLLGIALLSLLLRAIEERGVAYLGPMLRGWTLLATDFALFALARRVAGSGRGPAYALLLAALLGSAVVGEVGVKEFLVNRQAGLIGGRVFATSTPDFLAGYLVLLLPPTLALFVTVPLQQQKRPLIGIALTLLLLLVLGYQTMVLLMTQSRTALVSLAVGFLVFVVGLWRAWRAGSILERSSIWRLAAIGVFLLLVSAAFAKPLITRLRHTSVGDNSTAFRLYTWRGSVKMAAANPVLGTGVGTYVFLYPRYAITGFTRLAHESYLQMADECGLPGLCALLLALGFSAAAIRRGLSVPPVFSGSPRLGGGGGLFLPAVAPPDDRVLLCGLLAGLSASAVQNLTDSDWYVFFLGAIFWALAGLAVGLAEAPPAPKSGGAGEGSREDPAPTSPLTPPELGAGGRITLGVLAALILVRMATQGVAAGDDRLATAANETRAADSTAIAEQGWADAAQWNPLNARYPGYLGFQVFFQREGRLADAENALRRAVLLEPTSLNYATLGKVLTQEGRAQEAVQALQDGLKADPHSLDILLDLSALRPAQAAEYDWKITQLEDSPVGRVRAIGNVTEYKFVFGDVGVADAAFAAHDAVQARLYYARAERLLEAYIDEGGTMNIQRQALIGDHPNPSLDRQMRDIYTHVMGRLILFAPPAAQAALRTRAVGYDKKFDDVFLHASQSGIL